MSLRCTKQIRGFILVGGVYSWNNNKISMLALAVLFTGRGYKKNIAKCSPTIFRYRSISAFEDKPRPPTTVLDQFNGT